jgi:hypothetical protein
VRGSVPLQRLLRLSHNHSRGVHAHNFQADQPPKVEQLLEIGFLELADEARKLSDGSW